MDLISVFLIAIALALDCLAISVSVGLCRKETPQGEILKIGLFFGLFQAGMTLTGAFCGKFLSELIGFIDHWISFGLLAFIGVHMIWEAVHGGEEQTFTKKLSYKTLLALGIATSLDALAVGLSFGLIGHEMALTSTIIGLVAFCAAEIGVNFGKKAGKKMSSKWAEIAGGIVLLAIGFKTLLEHLTA